MAPLTELQQQEMREALGFSQTDQLEPEEETPDPRVERAESWARMVGRDWDINETSPAEQKEFLAPIFEGMGPQIKQIFKNVKDAAKLTVLEGMGSGIVGPSGGYWFPETQTEREEWNRQIEETSKRLLEEIRLGIKEVEDLNPEDLSILQEGIRGGFISFAMMAPLLIASIMAKSPTPLIVSMGFLTAGDSYTSGRAEGLSHEQALLYGGIDGFIESVTEILPAKALLRLFPGAKNAAGSFSKQALKFILTDVGGEQAATWLQNINAYHFDLDKQRLAIELDPNLNGLQKEEALSELNKQRAATTFIATIVAGGMQVGVAKMMDYGMSEQEIIERLQGPVYEQLTVDERNEVWQEILDWQELQAQEISPQEKVKIVLAQTGAAQSGAVQSLNELEGEKQSLLADPELKKDPKKLKEKIKKIDAEIVAAEARIERINKVRIEFEEITEGLSRLKEIEDELAYSEDEQIITDLEQEQSEILARIKMQGPQTDVELRDPVEYTPYEPEEGVIVLEDTPEAKKQAGKTGFFNSTVQKLYDELIEPETAERIVTAYNTIRQKMAASGYVPTGIVDQNAPLIIKQAQKDLRRLLRLSKNLLNKRLAIRRLQNKLAEGTIEETEYNKKVLEANQAIAETETNIEGVVERSQEPLVPMPELPETMNNPYGRKSRFFAPKSLWRTLREKIIPYEFDNTVVYFPTEEDVPLKDKAPEELEEEIEPRPQIAFEDLPEDAKIKLYFYNLAGGQMEPLMDPLTGKVFFAEYDGIEFIDPLAGLIDPTSGKHKLKEGLLPSIEMDGKTYQALWEPGTLSRARVSTMSNPAMAPKRAGLLPKSFEKEDIDFWTGFWYNRYRSFFTPLGVRPGIMEELQSGPGGPIAKRKISERQINRIFRDIANIQKTLEKSIKKGLVKIKADVGTKGVIYESGGFYLDPLTTLDRFKELIAKSFRGNKDAQNELRRLGQTELVEAIIVGRKRISKNSRRIIDLVKLIDPNASYYTKEKIKLLEDSIERYMGRIFGAYIFPDWKPPNRTAARLTNSAEWKQHQAAVEELAAVFATQEGVTMAEATQQAEEDMDVLYKGMGQQQSKLFVEMFDLAPPYLTADKTGRELLLPQLKQKRLDLPKEVRKALGELDESWANAQMTAFKQEQFIAITEYLLDVAEIGNAPTTRFLSAVPYKRYDTQISVPGDVLNPLNGYWTTKQMAQAIMKTMGYGPLRRYLNNVPINKPVKDIYLALQASAGYVSIAYLTLSLKTQNRNFQSAMLFPLMSGNWQAYQNPKTAARYIKEKFSDMSSQELDFIITQGVTASSVNVGERKAMLDRLQGVATWQEFYDFVEHAEGQKIHKIKKGWRKLLHVAEESYVAADDIPKIMTYLGERDSGYAIFAPQGIENLTEEQIEARIDMISELMVEMGGQKVSRSRSTPAENLEKAIQQRASFLTRRNIPNYNRLPNLIDWLRLVFLSNFAGFPTAVMTSQANIMKTTMLETNLSLSSDPAVTPGLKRRLRQRAAMRAAANLGWMTIAAGRTSASALRFGVKAGAVAGVSAGAAAWMAPQALSYFVAPWAGNHDFIILGDADDEGVVYIIDFSYTDGFTLISDPGRLLLKYVTTRHYLGPEASEKIWDTFLRSLRDLRGTYLDSKIILKVAQELWTGKNSETGAELWDPNLSVWETWRKRQEHVYKELSPKIVHENVEIGKAIVLTGEEALDKNMEERSLLNALGQAIGLKINGIDPKQIINDYKLSEFNNRFKDSDEFAKNVFRRAEGSELGYDDMPAMIAAYDELQRQHFEQVKDLRLGIHWYAPLMQTSPEEVIKFLGKEGRITSMRTADRANILTPSSKNQLYVPTDIDNFVTEYGRQLKDLQEKNPDLLPDKEIKARLRTLAKEIKLRSYDKWAQKPVTWTWQGVAQKVKIVPPLIDGEKPNNDMRKALGFPTKD